MAEPTTPLPLTASRADQIFPTLTPAQIRRIAAHGRARSVRTGEVLVEQGDKSIPFFVVISGELEAVRPSCAHETLITIVRPGQFTRRGQHAFRTARARANPGATPKRSDRTRPPGGTGLGSERRRIEPDPDARLHSSPGGVVHARHWGRNAGGL